MTLALESLEKALNSLETSIRLHHERATEGIELEQALRDSVIQRFEYTYELCWKFMQRWLTDNVSPEAAQPLYSRKELFRLAARQRLIDDPTAWFAHHAARNVSAHTYNEDHARQAFQSALQLAADARTLLERLKEIHD